MVGKEAIIAKIIEKAKYSAKGTIDEAKDKANEIILNAKNFDLANTEKVKDESISSQKSIIERKISVAELEVKKMQLKAKHEVIDECFELAKDTLKNQTNEYISFLIKIIAQNIEKNDEVVLSSSDKSIITSKFSEELIKKVGFSPKISFSENISGGVILKGISYDKNLSLDSMMKSMKEQEITGLAKILFEN